MLKLKHFYAFEKKENLELGRNVIFPIFGNFEVIVKMFYENRFSQKSNCHINPKFSIFSRKHFGLPFRKKKKKIREEKK